MKMMSIISTEARLAGKGYTTRRSRGNVPKIQIAHGFKLGVRIYPMCYFS